VGVNRLVMSCTSAGSLRATVTVTLPIILIFIRGLRQLRRRLFGIRVNTFANFRTGCQLRGKPYHYSTPLQAHDVHDAHKRRAAMMLFILGSSGD